ncbi:unnamed protein product [Linum trigynum]|uniref:Aminotransferase-like plant mobile domain-containing protein n=1 Tax=Linum trigynum TaxID=586398 RepID=A0AAV2DW99_9ROSI
MSFLSGDSFLMTPALFCRQQWIFSFTGALYPHPVGENRHRHQQIFAVKPILPICTLDPYAFAFVDIVDPITLIDSLGWLPMGDSPPRGYCPAAVRAFYSNLRTDGITSGKFSTLVYGHLLTLSVDDLAAFLILPTRGKQLISPLEFWSYKFDLHREVTNRSFDSLDESLKLLHYYITRVYFPRADRLDVVLPLDCWVMSHAISDMPLSYPHQLFGAIVDADANDSPSVGLPFAAMIALLLHRLGVPLADFVTISDDGVHPSIDEVLAVVGLPPIVDLSSGGDDHGCVATDAERGEEAKDEASADGGASASTSVRPFKLKRQAKGPRPSNRVLKRLNNQKPSQGVVLYENHDLEQNN